MTEDCPAAVNEANPSLPVEESPLQPYDVANEELLAQKPALFRLGPLALSRVEAVRGRMLLHVACRFAAPLLRMRTHSLARHGFRTTPIDQRRRERGAAAACHNRWGRRATPLPGNAIPTRSRSTGRP